ncbi:MAG: hypothetical protein LBV78_19005, partial [Kitasatospora sp.]|nr:hypothetical protein [Kitasatospora sp.]
MTYISGDPGQDGPYYRPPGAQPEPEYHDHFPLHMPYGPPPKRRRAGRIALVTITLAVLTVIAGVGIVKALPGNNQTNTSSNTSVTGFRPTAHSPSADAEQIATAFLR